MLNVIAAFLIVVTAPITDDADVVPTGACSTSKRDANSADMDVDTSHTDALIILI